MRLHPALALVMLLSACAAPWGGHMSITDVRARMAELAQKELGLKEAPCPARALTRLGAVCYGADHEAEEFARRVDALEKSVLRPVTGWRDDYGTMSGAYQYRQEPYEMGLNFVRSSEAGPAYVAILVSDEPPRDR